MSFVSFAMEYLKCYLFISHLSNFISIFSSSYLYAEYGKTFRNIKRFSINISFRGFDGFLLYAIDTDGNRMLVEMENFYGRKQISLNFNGILHKISVIYHTDSVYHFAQIMRFETNKLLFDQGAIYDIFPMKRVFPDSFENYPVPNNYSRIANKTYFWIGNVGPYTGMNGIKYEALRDAIFGCIHFLYIDFKKIQIINNSKNFSKSCTNSYRETICVKDNCSVQNKSENFLDCSFSGLNTNRMCYKDLFRNDNQSVVYKKFPDSNESTSFKIIWKQERFEKFCLTEIDMKDGSYFIFYITENNELSKCFIENRFSPVCTKKSLFNVTTDEIHVLMFTFDNSQVLIKISNGKYIQTFKDEFQRKIKQIKIGYSENTKSCVRFQGEITFRYDISQFKLICPSKISSIPHKIYFFLSLIYDAMMTFLFAVLCTLRFCSNSKQKVVKITSPIEINNNETTYVEETGDYEPIYSQIATRNENTEAEPSVYDYVIL